MAIINIKSKSSVAFKFQGSVYSLHGGYLLIVDNNDSNGCINCYFYGIVCGSSKNWVCKKIAAELGIDFNEIDSIYAIESGFPDSINSLFLSKFFKFKLRKLYENMV